MYTTKNDSDVTLYYYRNDDEHDDARVYFEYYGFSTYDVTINVGEYDDITKQINWEPDITLDELREYILNDLDIYIKVRIRCKKMNSLEFSVLKFALFLDDAEFTSYKCEINKQNSDDFDDATLIKKRTVNLYDPQRFADASKHLQDIMSKGCSDIFGQNVIWFKVTHNEDDAIHAFREYEFGTSMQQNEIRVVIKDNEIPDNRTRFSEFDIDFQDELEIHIDKNEWKRTFGELIPSSDDYFFLSITNQMYIVNAPYQEKNFLQNHPYWKMLCTKYEKRNSVLTSDDVDQRIDELIDFSYDVTKSAIDDEKADTTAPTIPSEHTIGQIFHCKRIVNGQLLFEWAYQNREKTYEFNASNEFTISLWFRLNMHFVGDILVLDDAKISMIDEKLVFATNSGKKHISAINKDKWHALTIAIKKVETMSSEHLVISIWLNDGQLNNITEVQLTSQMHIPNKFTITSKVQYANVRVNKKALSESMPLSYKIPLLERNVPSKQNYIIDNAMPELTEPQKK